MRRSSSPVKARCRIRPRPARICGYRREKRVTGNEDRKQKPRVIFVSGFSFSSLISGRSPMAQITYLQAIRQALTEEMERDPTTFILGEDVALSAFGSTRGLFERFGAERVRDTPISEAGFVGAAVGAAMAGMRPICEIEIAPFIYCAFDQIVNQAAKLRYMSGGQARLPITFRTLYGAAGGAAAQHSETVYPHLLPVPGLKIVAPSGPADMLGLLKTAIRDDNPVVVFEHAALGRSREEVPDGSDFLVPIGKATVKREGKDVTLVAIGAMVPRAMA